MITPLISECYTFRMATEVIAEWEGREYEHAPKSADWYWALGIVAAAGAVASVLFGNILFAVLIIIAASAIGLHAAKQPPLHRFRLIESGLIIGNDLFPYERMVSFSVLENADESRPLILSIKTRDWSAPHLLVPLDGDDAEKIYAHFLHHVDEEEHPHSFTDLVAAWLGF